MRISGGILLGFVSFAFINPQPESKPVGEAIVQFAFGDSLVGWVGGTVRTGGWKRSQADTTTVGSDSLYRSVIMKTTDGGRSWNLQTVLQSSDESVEILAMYALDAGHA